MTPKQKRERVVALKLRGFDLSRVTPGAVMVRCSQCAAAVINGYAAHETGCPNQPHYCRECGTQIPNGRLCEDCYRAMHSYCDDGGDSSGL